MRKVVNFHGIGRPGSGYGDACVNIARSFFKSGIDVNFNNSRFRTVADAIGISGVSDTGNIDFFMGPPPYKNLNGQICNFSKSKRYSIIYFYWEADRLPDFWARNIKNANENR